MEVRGYVLAGGRSSRMGEDKAEMRLGGRTLLEIAAAKLRGLCRDVVVVGGRAGALPGVRSIADLRPGCGPMGGMEAALLDAGDLGAMFSPVDMPFLPVGLLKRMSRRWKESGARVCFAVVDGRAQPLLCLLRPEVLSDVEAALGRGEYKVRPMLEGATGVEIVRTMIATQERERVWPGWWPSDAEWAARDLWFANLNTQEEFAAGHRFAEALAEA